MFSNRPMTRVCTVLALAVWLCGPPRLVPLLTAPGCTPGSTGAAAAGPGQVGGGDPSSAFFPTAAAAETAPSLTVRSFGLSALFSLATVDDAAPFRPMGHAFALSAPVTLATIDSQMLPNPVVSAFSLSSPFSLATVEAQTVPPPLAYAVGLSPAFSVNMVGSSGSLSLADTQATRAFGLSREFALDTFDPAPRVAIAPDSVDFGTLVNGQTATRTIAVANTGNAALSVTAIALSGAGAAQFRVNPAAGAVAVGGQPLTVTITFAPTTDGLKTADLTLTHNGSGNRSVVVVKGVGSTVPVPDIDVSPAALSFGEVLLRSSQSLSLRVANRGQAALTVASIACSTLAVQATPAALSLAPGDSQRVTITLAPTAAGALSARLLLSSNDPDESQFVVPVTATARFPHVTLSADTLAFGRVALGQSAMQVLTLTNHTAGPISVTNIVPGDLQFAVSSRSFALAAGGSRDVTVTYTPVSGQSGTSGLTVVTSDTEVPVATVALTATPPPSSAGATIAVLPTTITFGSVALGQSRSVSLLVSNTGGSTLRVINLVSSTTDVTVSKMSFTVAGGAEELVTITLQPTQPGSLAETLELQTNDLAHPTVQVPMRATVTTSTGRPVLVLDTPALSFGQIATGQTSEFVLPVRNTGSAVLVLSNVVSDNVQVVASPTTLSIAPQETRSLVVRCRPVPGMPLTGRLTLYSNDTAQPQVGVVWSATGINSPYLALTRVTPADGLFSVATQTELQLVFNEPLYGRRGYTALDLALLPEPLSGPIADDVQVRGDGRTVTIPVTLAPATVYRLVVYGATGQSGHELFEMVESGFSTGAAAPALAALAGRIDAGPDGPVSGAVYLTDARQRPAGQSVVSLDGSFTISGVPAGTYRLYLEGSVGDGRLAAGAYDANNDGVADSLIVAAGVDQRSLTIKATVHTQATPTVASGPVAVDLDSAAGNQRAALLTGVAAGQSLVLEVYATAADAWTGTAVSVSFDTLQVAYRGAEAGDNLLAKAGGTALYLSRVDPATSTVEFGGAVLGATASTAVSGTGLLGRFRFAALDGFAGETALRITRLKVRTLAGQTSVVPDVEAVLRAGSNTPGGADTGPVAFDFNPAAGDQAQRRGGGATVGRRYAVQLHATAVPLISGWSARLEFDPTHLMYVSGSFQPSSLVPGLTPLVDEKTTYVTVGGASLGGVASGSGDGLLGTATFQVVNGFTDSTELVLRRLSWKRVTDGEQVLSVLARGTITAAPVALAGDFNSDGAVDFSDFFLFADAFGGTDPAFDLNGDGGVDFSDFFAFADAFGSGERAKLMALAHQYLGLPVGAGLQSTYPNPFNATMAVRYQVVAPGPVRLAVYGLTGQLVRVLVDDHAPMGTHCALWDGATDSGVRVASGAYLVRLETATGVDVRKVTLLR
jgi:hypothetical protein